MATTYLTHTFGSAGSLTTWTLSCWVKKVSNGIEQRIFSCDDDASGNNDQWFKFDSADIIQFSQYQSGYTQKIETNRKFTDCSGWYHIVLVWDTTNASAGDRTRLYVNGVRETSFSSEVQASSSLGSLINNTTYPFEIGRRGNNNTQFFPGNLSNIAFVDGTALDPTSFGEVDSTSGIWKFTPPTGITWGTNGFWLKGENSAALGTDSSGNTNTFTTGGGTPTQSIDTPSNVYCTWNPLAQPTGTLSNGNLSVDGVQDTPGTLGVNKGKWYWEYKRTNASNSIHWGICSTKLGFNLTSNQLLNGESNSVGAAIYVSEAGTGTTGYANAAGFSSTSYSGVSTPSISNGDVVGCALDISTSSGTLQWFNNGVSFGSATFTYDDSVWVYPFIRQNSGSTGDVNFGSGYFGTTAISSAGTSSTGDDSVWEYDCPANYYGLSTKNLNTYG